MANSPQRIVPGDLILLEADQGVLIDLVYADANHAENIFRTALYRPEAKLWLHRLFAPIVTQAARLMMERHGASLVLKDGLRTVEAQAAMQATPVVRANPQWCEGPNRMLSLPGQGAHPRGMAVDVAVMGDNGEPWDMGTCFDTMTVQSARACRAFPDSILQNRDALERVFQDAAAICGLPLLPLPSEWWDYRLPGEITQRYEPVSDGELPPSMRMT